MRIHRLDLVAFGPFAEPVSIDLDALSDAGLFLMTGATGAGKTSVLDAVCFALYGAVPGDRQSAKRLRSDHAPPGVAPGVTLEFTVAGRRFRIARSPAWERPKKRGDGTTTEQARVLVEERRSGTWQPQATRLDEAGHLVSGLLGMSLTQFCQVQLLPQGRFQAFLRADSGERHTLLQQLFRTSRFDAVEAWLRERRRRLRREAAHHHDRVADLVSRASEAAGAPLPDAWDVRALGPVAGDLERWARAIHAEAVAASHEAARRTDRAAAVETATRRAQESGRDLRERQLRLRRARDEHRALEADRAAHLDRARRLDAARRAAGVLPLLEESDRATAALAAADAAASEAVEGAARLLGVDHLPEEQLRPSQQRAMTGAADARALQPLVEERQRLVTCLERSAAARVGLGEELEEVERALAELPDLVARTRAAEAATRSAAERLPAARQEEAAAVQRLEAGRLVAELVADRTATESRHHEAVDLAQTLKERWLDVQERRLTGMAAEIAGDLVVGGCCPVCGSADHPHPAQPASDAPDAAAEREVRRALDDAELERHARAGAVRDLDTRIEHARERSGRRKVSVLEREVAEATAVVARLRGSGDGLAAATAAREQAEQAESGATERRADLRARLAALDTGHEERRRRATAIDVELERVLSGTSDGSVSELATRLTEVDQACARALATIQERNQGDRTARSTRDRAARAVAEHGFATPAEARAAGLTRDVLTDLATRVTDHELSLAAAGAVLADPELLAAGQLDSPDLERLDAAQVAADTELATARSLSARAVERAERLARLDEELVAAASAWRPVLAELDLADRLASLVDGTSTDNRLRMRLSGYVLAFRLSQVVAAANERLVGMSDGRYRLEHTGERGAGETRGGLSLLVRDDWTGESRDPVTLSGGETFVVSLALALGLADVITFEAGGAELDTLFVDEGFGSLDADTLDDVMDMLDTLRDGGRVVGVVSHVAELRDRIPTQLHVRKLRTGSTIGQAGVG